MRGTLPTTWATHDRTKRARDQEAGWRASCLKWGTLEGSSIGPKDSMPLEAFKGGSFQTHVED